MKTLTLIWCMIALSAVASAQSLPQMKAQERAYSVHDLFRQLRSQDAGIRASAADALRRMLAEAKEAVPALIAALKDQDVDVRGFAAEALGRMGVEAKEAVPALIATLKDQNEVVRRSAAEALGRMGAEAKEAMPDLIATLKDRDEGVRSSAAEDLGEIATLLFDTRSTENLDQLKAAYDALNAHPDSAVKQHALSVKRTIDYFESLWWIQAREGFVKIISNHPYISNAVAIYLLLQFSWLLFFWLRPLSLLKVITSLSRTGEKLKIPKADIPIPLKTALVFPLFHYRPRLLDAWVRHHLVTARKNFAKKPTVSQRNVFVAMPALIDEQMNENISATTFQRIFEMKKVTMLIAGEGGAGKTSLACQMATWAMADKPEQRLCKTHRMLPVLIETNFEPRTEVKDLLANAVSGGLREMIGEPEPVFEELLLHMLRKRRILVIVDSLSELDEMTRKSVLPAEPNFPVAALVVTSRNDETLGGALKTTLRPIRLRSDRLSTFIDRYLEQRSKRELFEDDEDFFDACRRLPKIVGGRDITVLIASMYLEQLISLKESLTSDRAVTRKFPSNLPGLMLGYVENLNDQVQSGGQEFRKVIRVAKAVAWECLKYTCRPTPAKRDDVLKALNSEADAASLLGYLEERLKLVQTIKVSDTIRFSLDPLAEYLAAFYLVERCGKIEDLWREFFENAEKQSGAPESINGFLLAVRDCCAEKGIGYDVPDWVGDKLARLAGLDSETIKTTKLRQRIVLLTANLRSPDADDRIRAIEVLGEIGMKAKEAVPVLITALKDQDADVRGSAAYALGEIGKEAVPTLIAALEDQEVFARSSAAYALGKIGKEAKEAVPALIKALEDQDANVRSSAVRALGEIVPGAKEAVLPLIGTLEDQDANVRSSAVRALGKIGPGAKEAVPALIAALKDHELNYSNRLTSFPSYTVEALGKIGKESTLALIEALKDQDSSIRQYAVSALGEIGPGAKEAVPALIEALKDQDSFVRRFAAGALGRIGPEAKEAVPALIEALKDQDSRIRRSAVSALGRIRLEAKGT